MAVTKEVKKYQDPWETSQEDWQWFNVPSTDIFGKPHPGFSLNKHEFKPGQRYLVPPEIAAELNERSQVFNTYTARLLQDTIDYDALRKVGSIQ